MLKEITIDKEKYFGYKFFNSDKSLTGLSKINIFIGQNNSGKSRFLRTFFSDETFEFILKKHDHAKLKELIG
jgi:AAA15 family ATPase/GTPase